MIYFLTPLILSKEVCAAMGFSQVLQECPEDRVFVQAHVESPVASDLQQDSVKLNEEIFHGMRDLNKDISCIRELSLQVDDF